MGYCKQRDWHLDEGELTDTEDGSDTKRQYIMRERKLPHWAWQIAVGSQI